MSTLTIFDRSGKEVGTYDIDPSEISPRVNKQLLHDAVVMYQANQRLGSAKTKSRGEVSASTRKLYRQKGTGNARAGHRRSGVRRGGGHIFAIRPRDYTYRLPRKAVQLATRMAIASKVRDGEVVVVDDLAFGEPSTKEMAGLLSALGLAGLTVLVVTDQYDLNVYKSARNITGVSVSPVLELNALSVLSPRKLLVTPTALDRIKERCTGDAQGVAAAVSGG